MKKNINTIPYLRKSHHRLFSHNQLFSNVCKTNSTQKLFTKLTYPIWWLPFLNVFIKRWHSFKRSLSIPNFCWYRIPDHWTKVSNRTFTKSNKSWYWEYNILVVHLTLSLIMTHLTEIVLKIRSWIII